MNREGEDAVPLQEACDLVGAKLEVIPDADNSGRITLPSSRVRYFHRLLWDLNTLGAAAIAPDKDATARVLKQLSHTVPTGRSFSYYGRLHDARDIGGAYDSLTTRIPSLWSEYRTRRTASPARASALSPMASIVSGNVPGAGS